MRVTAYSISLILSLFLLIGCNNDSHKVYRIGVAQCSSDAWRWQTNNEIERELMFHDNATVEIRSADDINEKQIDDIRYFIDNGFDLILLNPTQADAITPVAKEAHDAGIPIVTFDRRINGDFYTAHIEVDNAQIGEEAADYANLLFPHGAKILEIQGNPEMTPTIRRHNGFADGITKAQQLRIVASEYAYWKPERAAEIVDSVFRIIPDIDLIYAHSDAMGISASNQAKQLGHNVKVISIDGRTDVGIKAVSDSVLTATFIYPTYGYELIRKAIDILDGKPYEREEILPPMSVVDINNADILIQQDNVVKEETNKIILLRDQMAVFGNKLATQKTVIYAAAIILILMVILLFVILRTYRLNQKHNEILLQKSAQLEAERNKQDELYKQLQEATQSKFVFFTNVSHDLRTPLTLIAEPVEQLANADYLEPQHKSLIKIADKNVKILKRLINQILDFRKYENGKLSLNLAEANLYALICDWVEAFRAIAAKRHINFTVEAQSPSVQTAAVDIEKMERIFFNLVSNAFKYTLDGGKIAIKYAQDNSNITFSVSDTGIGISQENVRNIFDRFYQVEDIHPQGSGIGLALAKAFVELHDGSISVESEKDKGSTFTVTIPVKHTDNQAPATDSASISVDELETIDDIDAIDDDKPLMLVIDDNYDIQVMIKQLMSDEYSIITASNGQQGLSLAAKYIPDIIICDVMMPIMDGLTCCKLIKHELSTSHIPVLMLTACTMDEQKVQGYDSGADGYLSKPFNSTVIKARCRNLIDNRKRIMSCTKQEPKIKPEQNSRTHKDIDSEFYAQFISIIESNIDKRDLDIETIAGQMGLGHRQFTRKIKALTNFTPVEIVREVRLKNARKLLITTEMTISQISYASGFASPAYFAKCYKDEFDETPVETRSRLSAK